MPNFKKIGTLAEMPPGERLAVELEGDLYIVAFNVNGELYAIEDYCSHQDFELSTGELDEYCIQCNYHGARFDIRDGSVKAFPANKPILTLPIKAEGDDILVDIEPLLG